MVINYIIIVSYAMVFCQQLIENHFQHNCEQIFFINDNDYHTY
jgi:hypothetical protein